MSKADEPKQAEPPPYVYRLNLVLFVALMVLLTLWFERHLRLYVTEMRLVGGTITLWGLWKLVQSWWQWGFDTKAAAKGVLGRTATTERLVFAVGLAAVLLGTTASIYLVYDEASEDAAFTVDVLGPRGHPYLAPLSVKSVGRTSGRPFLLHLRRDCLRFEVREPSGYQAVTGECLGPGSSVQLKTGRLKLKELHAVCMVPGKGVFARLPRRGDRPERPYEMLVTRKDERYAVPDLRQETVCVGAGRADLEWLVRRQDREALHGQLEAYLARLEVPPERRPDQIRAWDGERRITATSEFQAGDPLAVSVVQQGGEVVGGATLTVGTARGVQTVFLEAP
jgi:hypothetical protein